MILPDLPIFQECSRLNPHTGELDVFDEAWLHAAAARAAAGYLAPVHLGHHGDTDGEPPFAGFLQALHVDPARPGHPAVLRATVTAIPADIYARIRDRQLPYRSVEIHSVADPEISSLALLESTVPYFKFPITRVADEADGVAGQEAS